MPHRASSSLCQEFRRGSGLVSGHAASTERRNMAAPLASGNPNRRAIRRANARRLQATASHTLNEYPGWPSAQSALLGDAQRCPGGDWGSRGRRFKSGRPDVAHEPADRGKRRGQREFLRRSLSRLISLDKSELGTIWRPLGSQRALFKSQVGAQCGPCVRDGLGVWMQVALGGDQRSVPGHLPGNVDRHTGIGHPGEAGVAQVVSLRLSDTYYQEPAGQIRKRFLSLSIAYGTLEALQ